MKIWRKCLYLAHIFILLLTGFIGFSLFYFRDISVTSILPTSKTNVETKDNDYYIKAQKVDIKLTYIDEQPSKILLSTNGGKKWWVREKSLYPYAVDNSEFSAILDSTLAYFLTTECFELEGVFYKDGDVVHLTNPKQVSYAEYMIVTQENYVNPNPLKPVETVETVEFAPVDVKPLYTLGVIALLNFIFLVILSLSFRRGEIKA